MKKIISMILVMTTIFALTGCTTKKEVNVPVQDIAINVKQAMKDELISQGMPEDRFIDEQLPGYMEITIPSDDSNQFPGFLTNEIFNSEDIEEAISFEQMMNVKSDIVIIIKAKDESKIANLQASLEEIKQKQEDIWSQYLPDQYEKVKNNVIKTNGNYLIYVTFDNPEAIIKAYDEALSK